MSPLTLLQNFLLVLLICSLETLVSSGETESWAASLEENEKLALEAIRYLHRQLDDDKDGNINLDESNDFLREELKYERDYEKRQKAFHQNNDNQVTVRELWETWVKSEVHNWTVDQTVDWLTTCVGLPQYQPSFIEKQINGSYLPILAVNHLQFLLLVIGVKEPIHKQKISLKAQDVVLFGPPKENNNHIKDAILTTLLAIAVGICWFIYTRYKSSQQELVKMIKDMEGLAKAEKDLQDVLFTIEANKSEHKLSVQAGDSLRQRSTLDEDLPYEEASEEVGRLRGEVEVLRNELQRAEVELQDKCWVPPPALQHWLQLTYELELKGYNKKKQSAERQLRQAKDACDKLKKKRSSLMGAFVSTHGKSIDDVDKAILEAKTSLTEITHELQERMHRWKQIEMLVSCPIVNNPGLHYLETVLRGYGKASSYAGPGSVISNSQDDIDDDAASSIYCPSAGTSPVTTAPARRPTIQQQQQHQQQQQQQQQPSALNSPCSGPSSPVISMADSPISIPHSQTFQGLPSHTALEKNGSSEIEDPTVSAPATTSNMHLPIMRSKSVTSMISLRDRASRELMNRDREAAAAAAAEEDIPGEASEMVAGGRDRRVTFGIRSEHRIGRVKSESFPMPGGSTGEALVLNSSNRDANGLERKLNLRKSHSSNQLIPKTGLLLIQKPEGNEKTRSSESEEQCATEEPDLIKLSPGTPNLTTLPPSGTNGTNGSSNGVDKRQTIPVSVNQKAAEGNAKDKVMEKRTRGSGKNSVWKSISNLVSSNGGEGLKGPRGYKIHAENGNQTLKSNQDESQGKVKPASSSMRRRTSRLFSSFRSSQKQMAPQA